MAGPATASELPSIDRDAVRGFVERQTIANPGERAEISVGEPATRFKLSACARTEFFVPRGARLRGNANIGVRCIDGQSSWTLYVPVQIKIFGSRLVAARALNPGANLDDADVRVADIDITWDTAGALTAPPQVRGQVLTRTLASGQPLRREYLHSKPVVAPGDPIKVVVRGSGFAISTEGKALTTGAEGDAVRIQTESGRILSGVARAGRVVEVMASN